MAELVLGLATSHTPQLSVPWEKWNLLREKDEHDKRLPYKELLEKAKPGIENELASDVWQRKDEATQQGIRVLGEVLSQVNPDIIVILGDDQHEQFLDNNMPMLSIYNGETIPVVSRSTPGEHRSPWSAAEADRMAETEPEYPAAPDLAEHLLDALTLEEFDVGRTNALREEVGIGHAFAFLYRRILPGTRTPIVPFMVNTYYPPNQPTSRRCYKLGHALRRSIESWPVDSRVAVMASGGLSHIIMDEELDRVTVDALTHRDSERLCSLPREKMKGGTSEILNWVAVAGAAERMDMTLVDYVPGYRSPAATGCGMAFAYWQ